MRVSLLAPLALLTLRATALLSFDDKDELPVPTATATLSIDKRSQTNEQTTECTGACITNLEQSNSGGDPNNANSQTTDCYGSCVLYIYKQQQEEEAKKNGDGDGGGDGDTDLYGDCTGSCAVYTMAAAAAKRYLPGSHDRREWEVAPPMAT